MQHRRDQRLMGTVEQLAPLFMTTVQNGIFLIGIDMSDPAYPAGAAILFSGDDEFYGQISDAMPASALGDLAVVFHAADKRIAAMMRSPGRRVLRRALPRAMPDEISGRDLETHSGLVARRPPFAIIRTANEVYGAVIVHLLIQATGRTEWRTALRVSSGWLGDLARLAEEASKYPGQALVAQPSLP